MNKLRLQKILSNLSNKNSLESAFKSVENEMKKVADKLREEASQKADSDSKKRVMELKVELREDIQRTLETILDALEPLKAELEANERTLTNSIEAKLITLRTSLNNVGEISTEQGRVLTQDIENIKEEIRELSQRKIEIPDFASQIQTAEQNLKTIIDSIKGQGEDLIKELEEKVENYSKDFLQLRQTVMSAVSHGGNANRNILVAGNSSTLSRYTDLNIKPGANITLTYVNNDNLKTTDLTITSSGGAGTSRSISTVAVSSVVSDTAATDHVIIASQGVLLTMPTAVSNTNLYTIKNTAASSVMVKADGSETIDGDANIILGSRYTAVDLISDNANWHIT